MPITHPTTKKVRTMACYLQIPVKNEGHAPAEMVEVFVAGVEKETDGIFRKIDSFYPLSLKWRHYNEPFMSRISPASVRDCTLGHLVEPQYKRRIYEPWLSLDLADDRSPFQLDLAVIPNTRTDLLLPGKYRLLLEIGASNTIRIKKRIVELEFSGKWLPNMRDMAKVKPV